MMNIRHTDHSAFRSAQRGLTDEEIEYVYQFSSRFHQGGAMICFLRQRDLPAANHLVGTALVLDKEGKTLITVWRNRRSGMKIIRKKTRYYSETFDRL
jgi:hypothetical protein